MWEQQADHGLALGKRQAALGLIGRWQQDNLGLVLGFERDVARGLGLELVRVLARRQADRGLE